MRIVALIALWLWMTLSASAATFDQSQPTVLITGSNRGLGLEFARQYAAMDWNVIASCRDPKAAEDLKTLAGDFSNVAIEKLDVTNDAEVEALAGKYQDQPVDVLLSNAGVYGTLAKQTLGSFDFEEAKRVIDINAIASLRLAQAFQDNVVSSDQKKIISLGGGMGTLKIGPSFGGHYFMKMSKAAHLMAMGVLQTDLKDQGVIVTMISPGRVNTQLMRDSGFTGPSMEADESAARVIERIAALDPSLGGKLVMYNGMVIPY